MNATKSRRKPATAKKRGKKKLRSAPLLRTSERTTFKRCLWQWDQGYNKKLSPLVEAPALRFGTLIHKALELRYPPGKKRGPKPAETFERLYEEELEEARKFGFRDADGDWADAGELGVDMLENYVEHYGRDEEWEVIASEMTFKVPVYSPEHPDGGFINLRGERIRHKVVLFYYVGTIDGVWKNRMDPTLVVVNDYKTTSGDPEKEAQGKWMLDEQGTAYWTWGADYLIKEKILKPRDQQSLAGMLYTFLRKAKRDTRPKNADGHYLNKDGSVSKRQPGAYFHREVVYRSEQDREKARERVIQEATEMEMRRRGVLPIYKNPGLTFPDQQCKGCPFFDMCELHEVGADWEGLRDGTMTTWDPYGAHEIKEEGKR